MIGDWGVHILGSAAWALQLGSPVSVECTAVSDANPITYPNYACKFEFSERPNKYVPSGKMKPVTVYWYEGLMARQFKALPDLSDEVRKPYNAFFVGTKGYMGTGGHGNSARLLPESAMKDFQKPPQVLKRVVGGHHKNWINACKGGEPPCSNFSVAGPYTEWLLLGAISWRFPNEKLLWDSKALRFTNNEKANEFIKPYFRKGWELQDITV